MTDEELPTECPHCDTPLEFDVMGGREATIDERGSRTAAVVDVASYCPNPDCPRNETDMAKVAES